MKDTAELNFINRERDAQQAVLEFLPKLEKQTMLYDRGLYSECRQGDDWERWNVAVRKAKLVPPSNWDDEGNEINNDKSKLICLCYGRHYGVVLGVLTGD